MFDCSVCYVFKGPALGLGGAVSSGHSGHGSHTTRHL